MEAGKQPLERGTGLALFAMAAAVLVIANDFSAINVAIPQIEEDFETDVTTAQWVVNAYALTFGVLIVTGGRLADLFGRRPMLMIGIACTLFTAFWCTRLFFDYYIGRGRKAQPTVARARHAPRPSAVAVATPAAVAEEPEPDQGQIFEQRHHFAFFHSCDKAVENPVFIKIVKALQGFRNGVVFE